MTLLMESFPKPKPTQVVRSIPDSKQAIILLANAFQLLHHHTPKDEQRAWKRVRTGVRTIGVMRSFTPSSCDDCGLPRSCHPCSLHCMTRKRASLVDSPIIPGPKITNSREDGRRQEGPAAWNCILLFCHLETVVVSS